VGGEHGGAVGRARALVVRHRHHPPARERQRHLAVGVAELEAVAGRGVRVRRVEGEVVGQQGDIGTAGCWGGGGGVGRGTGVHRGGETGSQSGRKEHGGDGVKGLVVAVGGAKLDLQHVGVGRAPSRRAVVGVRPYTEDGAGSGGLPSRRGRVPLVSRGDGEDREIIAGEDRDYRCRACSLYELAPNQEVETKE